MVPPIFTVGCHNCESGTEFTVNVTALCITLRLVVVTLPAASVTVKVTVLVPLFKGRFCTQNLPDRSTNPFTVLVAAVDAVAARHRATIWNTEFPSPCAKPRLV